MAFAVKEIYWIYIYCVLGIEEVPRAVHAKLLLLILCFERVSGKFSR